MQTRYLSLDPDIESVGTGTRTVPAVLSSDAPCNRGSHDEILTHTAVAINLSRFPLPLICGHDISDLPVGVAENPVIANGKLRATIRFSESIKGDVLLADVEAGILRSLSIGYQVNESHKAVINGRETLVVTRWQPVEVSAVSAPLDINAGFNRSLDEVQNKQIDGFNAKIDAAMARLNSGRSYSNPKQPRVASGDELLESLPDFFGLVAMRTAASRHASPLAIEMKRARLTLDDIKSRSGATTSDFHIAMANGLTRPLISAYSGATKLDFLESAEVADYKQIEFPLLDGDATPTFVPEDGELSSMILHVNSASTIGQLREYAQAFKVSRRVMLSYPEAVTSNAQRIGKAFARLEQERLATILESGTLNSAAFFDASNSYSASDPAYFGLSAALPTISGIGAAMSFLRRQTNAAGDVINASLGTIVIPPGMEAIAVQARHDLGLTYKICASPWLSSDTTWYAIAPASEATPIIRLVLRGSTGMPFFGPTVLGSGESKSRAMVASHSFEICPIERAGIVRVTA